MLNVISFFQDLYIKRKLSTIKKQLAKIFQYSRKILVCEHFLYLPIPFFTSFNDITTEALRSLTKHDRYENSKVMKIGTETKITAIANLTK